jgi:hypothetical protein
MAKGMFGKQGETHFYEKFPAGPPWLRRRIPRFWPLDFISNSADRLKPSVEFPLPILIGYEKETGIINFSISV